MLEKDNSEPLTDKPRPDPRAVAKKFLLLFLPLAALVCFLFYTMHRRNAAHERDLLLKSEAHFVGFRAVELSEHTESVVEDLRFLRSRPLFIRFMGQPDRHNRRDVEQTLLAFAKENKEYDQIRLLDTKGMEALRVNRKQRDVSLATQKQLQDKSQRYYFKDTLRLGPDKVFISPLDLNVEHGAIEKPFKPMLRFGMPVFGDMGDKKGILIFNYLGDNILEHVRELARHSPGNAMLLNADGYWLEGAPDGDNWGFMFPDKQDKTFAKAHPALWKRMLREERGQEINAQGLLSFERIHPVGKNHHSPFHHTEKIEHSWILLSHIPAERLAHLMDRGTDNDLPQAGLILILLAMGAWVLARTMEANKVTALSLTMKTKELEQTNLALSEAKRTADAASQAKSEFLARMSHEIRTPMNAVLGMTQMALETELNSQQQDYLSTARDSAEYLLGIINDILDLSRIEAGEMELENSDLDLHYLLRAIVKTFSYKAQGKGLAMGLEIDDATPCRIKGDPGKLRQILINMVGNALKFTKQGGIQVRVQPDPDRCQAEDVIFLRFEVVDTGIGIPPNQFDTIFNRFTQADGSITRYYGGTGLGLAICRELTKLMGGDIGVENEPGRGSRFYFTIPFMPGDYSKTLESSCEIPAALHAPCKPLQILVAEDNPMNTKVATAFLSRLGHGFTCVENGRDTLEALSRERFDLILMDVEMPGMDGLEATRRIRAGEAGEEVKDIPIVAMTAHALSESREETREAGMDYYMAKPVRLAELATLLTKAVSGGKGEAMEKNPQETTLPPSLLDRDIVLKALGGDEILLDSIQTMFAHQEIPNKLRGLQTDIATAEMQPLHLLAHSLKGTAAQVGAQATSVLAGELAVAARAGDRQRVVELVPELKKELERVGELLSHT